MGAGRKTKRTHTLGLGHAICAFTVHARVYVYALQSAIFYNCSFYTASEAEVKEVVTAYRQTAVEGFNAKELAFAEAVCCLRLLSVLKVGLAGVVG